MTKYSRHVLLIFYIYHIIFYLLALDDIEYNANLYISNQAALQD